MDSSRYLTAQEAAQTLGISLASLYSYVSRGLIRSEASGEGKRQRRYYAEDVERLLNRKAAGVNPDVVSEAALYWGTPVLESAITCILDNALYYRGMDATRLAGESSAEQVAALLWTGNIHLAGDLFASVSTAVAIHTAQLRAVSLLCEERLSLYAKLQIALSLMATDDLSAYDLRPPALLRTAALLWLTMVSVITGTSGDDMPVARHLQQAWCTDDPKATSLLNAALILCADHELNASSFTARIVASTGATLYAAVQGGLAALQGHKHGGHVDRVVSFLHEVGTPTQVRATIASRLQRGDTIPGFGHRLYPKGDPRAATLLQMVGEAYPAAPALQLTLAINEAVTALQYEPPSIDLALATLAQVLNLPAEAPLVLFALGRTMGWIAHAIEQYADGRLLRPRARYTGVQPL